jgi:hypothetical protein
MHGWLGDSRVIVERIFDATHVRRVEHKRASPTHVQDAINLGYVKLTEEDYFWITRQLVKVANTTCGGRVVSVLEGGYKVHGRIVSAFGRSVAAHVRALSAGFTDTWDTAAERVRGACVVCLYRCQRLPACPSSFPRCPLMSLAAHASRPSFMPRFPGPSLPCNVQAALLRELRVEPLIEARTADLALSVLSSPRAARMALKAARSMDSQASTGSASGSAAPTPRAVSVSAGTTSAAPAAAGAAEQPAASPSGAAAGNDEAGQRSGKRRRSAAASVDYVALNAAIEAEAAAKRRRPNAPDSEGADTPTRSGASVSAGSAGHGGDGGASHAPAPNGH